MQESEKLEEIQEHLHQLQDHGDPNQWSGLTNKKFQVSSKSKPFSSKVYIFSHFKLLCKYKKVLSGNLFSMKSQKIKLSKAWMSDAKCHDKYIFSLLIFCFINVIFLWSQMKYETLDLYIFRLRSQKETGLKENVNNNTGVIATNGENNMFFD